jgi:hypothetical protein
MGTPGVDGRHNTSNHVIEAEQTLGIEAASASLMKSSTQWPAME